MKLSKILIFFIIVSNLYSQSNWFIKGGTNFTSFLNQDSEFKTSYTVGLSRQIELKNSMFFVIEMIISRQGSIIKNKPIKRDITWEWILNSYDLHIVQTYFDLPLLFEYKLNRNVYDINILAGFSLHKTIVDNTVLKNEKVIYDESHPDKKSEYVNYDFEFIEGDYDSPGASGINAALNIGVNVMYAKWGIEFRYMAVLKNTIQFGQIHPVGRRLHSFMALLTYRLN